MYFPSASFDCLHSPLVSDTHNEIHVGGHSQNFNGVQRRGEDVRRERQHSSRDARRVPPIHVARARGVGAWAVRRPWPARPPRVGGPGGLWP